MSPVRPDDASSSGGFPSTHWSVVLAAGDAAAPHSREALAELCRKYWYPLYFYVRKQGYRPEDAQDLTQEFFTRFLEKNYLALADPHRGRFRSFLLSCLKHFLINEWNRTSVARRDSGYGIVPIDTHAEDRYRAEQVDDLTPEKAYEQRWALALLEQALARLGDEYVTAGKGAQFEALRGLLWGTNHAVSYADIAGGLDSSEGAVKAAVRRLRRRYREILRSEIAQTVATSEELEDEVRWLFATFE